jgi:hypothetical protein
LSDLGKESEVPSSSLRHGTVALHWECQRAPENLVGRLIRTIKFCERPLRYDELSHIRASQNMQLVSAVYQQRR